jgi:hypothetical protein
MAKNQSKKETNENVKTSIKQRLDPGHMTPPDVITDREITRVIEILDGRPGRATKEEIKAVLEWAKMARIQNAFFELFLLGLVTIEWDQGQLGGHLTPEEIRSVWRVWRSVTVQARDEGTVESLIEACILDQPAFAKLRTTIRYRFGLTR